MVTTAAAQAATAAQSPRKRVVVDDVGRDGYGKILVSADAPIIGRRKTTAAPIATAAQSHQRRVVEDDVARDEDGKTLVSADAPVIGIGEGDDKKVLPQALRTIALLRRTVTNRRSSRPP
jgi:hypothetical protein